MLRSSYMLVRDMLIYEYEYLDTTDELIQSMSIEIARQIEQKVRFYSVIIKNLQQILDFCVQQSDENYIEIELRVNKQSDRLIWNLRDLFDGVEEVVQQTVDDEQLTLKDKQDMVFQFKHQIIQHLVTLYRRMSNFIQKVRTSQENDSNPENQEASIKKYQQLLLNQNLEQKKAHWDLQDNEFMNSDLLNFIKKNQNLLSNEANTQLNQNISLKKTNKQIQNNNQNVNNEVIKQDQKPNYMIEMENINKSNKLMSTQEQINNNIIQMQYLESLIYKHQLSKN